MKNTILGIVILAFIFCSGFGFQSSSTGSVASVTGELYATQQSSLSSADAIAYSSGKQLVINRAYTIDSDTTLTAPITMNKGGSFVIATGKTLTINGAFKGGLSQWFSGAGSVAFGSKSVNEVPVDWFGSDGAAIQSALNSAKTVNAYAELSGQFGCIVRAAAGRYLVSSTIAVPSNVSLVGAGRLSTVLKADSLGTGNAVLKFAGPSSGQTHSKISDMTISGNDESGVIGIEWWDGTGSTQSNFTTIDNCYIASCAVGINVDSTATDKYVIYGKITNNTFENNGTSSIGIYLKNNIHWLIIDRNNFFSTGGSNRAIYTDSNTVPDSVWITYNSIDNVANSVDGASLYLTAKAGTQSVGYYVQGNRIENGGIRVVGTYSAANIANNYITSAPNPIYSTGNNVQIFNNTLYVKNTASATTNSTAIKIDSGAVSNVIGWNNFGIFGETTYAPIPVSDGGTRTFIDKRVHTSISEAGTHNLGDRVQVAQPSNGTVADYVCVGYGTINSSASATTGSIESGSNTLTVASATGYVRGSWITIAGVTGPQKIQHVSGTTLTVIPAADATVTGAAVALRTVSYRPATTIPKIGTTAARPTLNSVDIGVLFMDTTLDSDGLPIWWNGAAWVDATGATR